MTSQEFTERVKSEALKNVDQDFYTKVIEPIYMMVDCDKDFFCNSFNKAFGKLMKDDDVTELLRELAWFYKSSMDYEKKLEQEKKQLFQEIERLENALINNDLEEMVKLPKAELIRRKVRMGKQLTEEQKTYIINNLH